MSFDFVHDIQGVYRKVLDGMATPGKIQKLDEETEVYLEVDSYKGTLVLMLMLLDGEVTFNIVSKNTKEISNMISQITYSKVKNIEEADYIFLLEDATNDSLAHSYEKAKSGDLVNPNKSATIIAEVTSIEEGNEIEFRGPGIKECNSISINIKNNWIEKRAEKNIEFPMGIDAIFIDKVGNLIGLPRTTQVKRKGD